ncbi:MAG: hypothetical protein WCP21_13830 [Armatimonadota bacterium]
MTICGADSPGIYSTGVVTVAGAAIKASGAEAMIEGSNAITPTDTKLTTSLADKSGVMMYQSMSGDGQGGRGTFTMAGGSLLSTAAP